MAMAIFVVVILLVAAPAALATQHVVGGSSGWNQGVDYSSWAAGQTFVSGDTLLFTYGNSHSVDVVSQSDYTNCNVNSPQNSYTGGNTVISLTSNGPMYFICGTPGHCQGGMKVSVTVAASNGSTPNGSPPPPPPRAHSAAPAGNFGLLVKSSLLVVALVGFMG